MDDFLNWNNNGGTTDNGVDNDMHYLQSDNQNPSPNNPNIPTSTINDQDLLDFGGLDQFIPSGAGQVNNYNNNNNNNNNRDTLYLTPKINEDEEEGDDEDEFQRKQYQPQSYHLTPSSNNSKPMSSSLSGVRKSLSKLMTNSRKNSIIKDELSSSFVKSPRSRKSSIVGTPGSISNIGQTTSVERKRRDNINDKIQELLAIIPDSFFYENDKSTGTKDGKPNKGQILTKSVEYIQYLQNEIDFKNRKEVESIYRLKKLNYDTSVFTNTSAEIGLGKIGVGPLSHLQREEVKNKWIQQQQQQHQQSSSNKDHNSNDNSNDNNNNNNVTNYSTNDNDNQDFLNF